MQKISRKRTAKEVEEESKHLFKNNVESLTQDFNSLSMSTKRVMGQKKWKAHKSTTNKKELNKKLVTDDSLDNRLREEFEEDIYDRGNSSFPSESRLSSKYENEEEFWLVESDGEIMSSKEELKQNISDQLTTKQQLLKTFIDKRYSIYKIDKEKLIDSASKPNIYFLKRKLSKNWSFERRTVSGRNKKFDSEIDQKIVDLVRENQFISIKEVTNILKKDFLTTPSYGTIFYILKENGCSYVSPQLAPKTDEEINK